MKHIIFAFFITAVLLSCSNYGKKVSQDYLEVYYKNGASKDEAQKTLDFLYPLWKSADGKTETKSVQLTKTGDTINFRMVVIKSKLSQLEDETFYAMINLFSDSLYNGAPVNLVLSDNKFKPIRTFVYKKIDPDTNLDRKATAGNIDVYCKDGYSLEQAQTLANFLEKEMKPSTTISFQIGKTDRDGYIVSMVSDKNKVKEVGNAPFTNMAGLLSEKVFMGGRVIFELTDNKFNPFKKFESSPEIVIDTTAVQ